MLLSILIRTVHTRVSENLPWLINELIRQADEFNKERTTIQILYLGDNKTMTAGEKLNHLVRISDGRYIAVVDDDDRPRKDYIASLMEAIKSNADVIVFDVMRYEDGEKDKITKFDYLNTKDLNLATHYIRLPNHIMCFRRDIAIRVPYMNISWGEDAIFAKQVRQYIRTQHRINKVLYEYRFSKANTETQKHLVK